MANTSLGDVAVLGLGKTGLCVASYLADLLGSLVSSVTLYGGASSVEDEQTRALEKRGVRVVCGTEELEGHYDLAIASPGIPEHSAFILSAQLHATEVIGEPEFAWRQSPDRWIAITGTNGKTTTTMLTTHLLNAGGMEAKAVGNVGTVATGEVAGRADEWFVAELSSFQLAGSRRLHPRVACLLNISPDHLEWHGSMEAYAQAKERVFKNLNDDDMAVVSVDDELCRAVVKRLEDRGLRVCRVSVCTEPSGPNAAFVRNGKLFVRLDDEERSLVGCDSLYIRGDHNMQNALCSAVMAIYAGVSPDAVSHGLLSFKPLEHRIEPCGELGGIRFVNDSKATNVDSVQKALTAFVPGRVVVLLGGHDKGTALGALAHDVSARCRAAVCYGEAGARIAQALREEDGDMGLVVQQVPHMADALHAALELAQPGDVVLLSPACSSFDEFKGYTQRGKAFKRLVSDLVARKRDAHE